MSEDDTDGCGCAVAVLAILAFAGWVAWSEFHLPPEEVAKRQQAAQRVQEDRDLAEWNRAQQLREMRADKGKAEEGR